MSARVILSTASNLEEARRLAQILLDHAVAACVNLIPAVESHYVWKSQRQCDHEVLLIIKTTDVWAEHCLHVLRRHHAYECPEGIVLEVGGGLPDYLAWLESSVAGPDGSTEGSGAK